MKLPGTTEVVAWTIQSSSLQTDCIHSSAIRRAAGQRVHVSEPSPADSTSKWQAFEVPWDMFERTEG